MPQQGSAQDKWKRIRKQIADLFVNVYEAFEVVRTAEPSEYAESLALLRQEVTHVQRDVLEYCGTKRDHHVELKSAYYALQRELRELQTENVELHEHSEITTRKLDEYHEEVQAALALADEELARKDAYIADLEQMIAPPRPYGTFIRSNDDGTVDIMFQGNRVSAAVSNEIDVGALVPGQRLLLVPQGNVLRALDEFETRGEEGIVDELLSDGRVRVTAHTGDNVVLFRSEKVLPSQAISVGDHVLIDVHDGYVLEVLPKKESSELMLETIPELTYADIGGQDESLAKLRDHIELPLLHPERFARYGLPIGAGVLLHGPPGGGKTLALKVVASTIRKATQREVSLLYVAGPQLLTMWVGETERKIREPFELAKQKSAEGGIVIVLFDEIDAMFPTRGTRIGTSGIGETAVTQFSTMLDGVTEFGNIIVVGTTNRPDMIDPALTRPGRLYPPIEFPRPDREGTAAIFDVYLGKEDFPLHEKYQDEKHPEFSKGVYESFVGNRHAVASYMVRRLVNRIFGEPNATRREQEQSLERQRVVAIEYEDARGGRDIFYMKDIISGALIKAIVDRGKQLAIKDELATGKESGLRLRHLFTALEEVFREGEALPNRTNPEEWARVLNLPKTRPFRVLPHGADDSDDRIGRRRGRSAT